MILVDTTVWIGHLRSTHPNLTQLLLGQQVLVHPFVLGELAVGTLKDRGTVLSMLQDLPSAPRAQDWEIIDFIQLQRLHGRGLSFVDAHLLASVMLASHARLWTDDRRLHDVATEFGIGYQGVDGG